MNNKEDESEPIDDEDTWSGDAENDCSNNSSKSREMKKRKHENHYDDETSDVGNKTNECKKEGSDDSAKSFNDCAGASKDDRPMDENSINDDLLEQIADGTSGASPKFKFKRKSNDAALMTSVDRTRRSSSREMQESSDDSMTNFSEANDLYFEESLNNTRTSAHDTTDDEKGKNKDKDKDKGDTRLAGRHRWFSGKAIREREYGISSYRSPFLFHYEATGSLHMVQRLELMYKMESHDGCVNCLHFNSSGSRLASGSDDLEVSIWDWSISKPLISFESGHRGNVFQAKFMPLSGDCHIVTCARDGQIRLAELSVQGVCKGTRKLAQHRGAAHKLALELESPHVFLSCGEDAVVFEIDLRDPKPNKLLTCKESNRNVPLYSIHSHPRNPHYFAVCGRDQYCRIYDKRRIDDASALKKLCPVHLANPEASQKANVTCLVFNDDGSELLASYNDDDIFLFDVNSNEENGDKVIRSYTGHRNNATVKGVNFFGPRSEFVVSGSDCGYIYFWDKKTSEVVQFVLGDEQGVVNVLEPHPTAPFLATSGLDHDVKIWVPSNEKPVFDRTSLNKLMRKNARDRENDRRRESDFVDSNMLYLLLSHMHRNRRRRASGEQAGDEADGEPGSTTLSDNSGPDSDSDEESEDTPYVQCRQS